MSIKFGIIGCGRIAQRHAMHIDKLGQLVAVADIVRDKAEALASEYGCQSYMDIDTMLSNHTDIDVVSICTPNGLHAKQAIQCLMAGHHVLCEKPMAISVADAEQMINASLKANKLLFIVKQNRFNPPVEAVKSVMDEGHLGRIFSVQLNCSWNRNPDYYTSSDWKGTLAMDGGTLYTQFSHFVDLLYYFFGDISEACGFSDNSNHRDVIEFEDNGVVALRFFKGIIGAFHYTVNSFGKNMEGSLTIFGEKGTVKIGGQYLNVLEYQNIQDYQISDLPEGAPPNEYGAYVGSMSNHDKVYQNVIEVLTNQGIIATNAFEGLKTVEMIHKIYKAIQ